MTKVQPGDIVFSYFKQAIRAVGVANSIAVSMDKPSADPKWDAWDSDGWWVEVTFTVLTHPVVPAHHKSALSTLATGENSPLTEEFSGRQAYLLDLNEERTLQLMTVVQQLNPDLGHLINFLSDISVSESTEETNELDLIPAGETERAMLVRARKGQGLFRARVANYSTSCRVTGVSEPSLLRASHIKPWSKCVTNDERLDGANGLLLAPHVDLLFDKGLLTFRPTGELVISEVLPKYVITSWNIEKAVDTSPFKPRQAEYLTYHNDVVYPQGKERWSRG